DDVRLKRVAQPRAELSRVAEQLRAALQRGDEEPSFRPQLAWLYERLVRPVADRLGRPGTPLVLVTDGDVPADLFPALYDGRRGRYLVLDHSLRFVPALRDAAAAAPAAATPVRAVIAGDPAFDSVAHPGLERLPEAGAEARSVAAFYPGATTLRGREATRGALLSALARAQVVHFAGHAVFNDEHADRSYVVLAPDRGPGALGIVTAAELQALRLGGVRVVVLSACETLRSRSGRSGGFAGFAAALLGAGAGGVVGGSWKVEDRASRRIMVEFHRAYRESGDAATALRKAQLVMLRSPDPALSSPATWAAFRYAGH
ncbi:MAG TPA: CHAT domain-containing protein, partial [Longimicrobiaceae bacterium]|nr:CHAT domain-containing protein [Longimicrobiaceae bacterium]